MAHLQYFNYPGYGDAAKEREHYSQAVRIGDRIECSGQGAWSPTPSPQLPPTIPDSVSEQVDNAFANVELALKQAGGEGWSQVYKVRLYIVDLDDEILECYVRTMKKYCVDHQPLLTGLGVVGLAFGMRVELEVEAHVGR